MSNEYNWLQNLKPGDKVIRSSTGIGAPDTVSTVERVTSTQIIIGADKYRKVNGRRISDSSWYSVWLAEATPERIAEIDCKKRRLSLCRKLQDVQWGKLPTPILEAVGAIIDQHEVEQAKLLAASESEATNA